MTFEERWEQEIKNSKQEIVGEISGAILDFLREAMQQGYTLGAKDGQEAMRARAAEVAEDCHPPMVATEIRALVIE